MDDAASPSVITVFRSRLQPDAAANGYVELAAHMESRARAMAGFIDFKTFTPRRRAGVDPHGLSRSRA